MIEGYKQLKKRDFHRKLFAWAKPHKFMLSLKPYTRVLSVIGMNTFYLDMEVVTTEPNPERGVVTVRWEFLSMSGSAIINEGKPSSFPLFADPIGFQTKQRVYFEKPKGAAFVKVSMTREIHIPRLGMETNFRLRRAPQNQGGNDEDIQTCRSKETLEASLEIAMNEFSFEKAREILVRMKYLWRRPQDHLALEVLDGARTYVASGFDLGLNLKPYSPKKSVFMYDGLKIGTLKDDVPLEKQLKAEMLLVYTHMAEHKSGSIHVSAIGDKIACLLVAKYLSEKLNITIENVSPDIAEAEHMCISKWVTHKEIQHFLLH